MLNVNESCEFGHIGLWAPPPPPPDLTRYGILAYLWNKRHVEWVPLSQKPCIFYFENCKMSSFKVILKQFWRIKHDKQEGLQPIHLTWWQADSVQNCPKIALDSQAVCGGGVSFLRHVCDYVRSDRETSTFMTFRNFVWPVHKINKTFL